jgi:hypothetical protein
MDNSISVFDKDWWGNCVNTLGYEIKQVLFAQKIGLTRTETRMSPFVFDMSGASIIDIGGGPVSLLLKCINFTGTVLDPGSGYPRWVYDRYQSLGIDYTIEIGENLNSYGYDEAWIIDSLQHTINPELVLKNAKKAAKTVRVFEWINTVYSQASPHMLTENFLNNTLGVIGTTEYLNLFGYTGVGYSAVYTND